MLKEAIRSGAEFVSKNSTSILMVIGTMSFVGTIALTAKHAPDAKDIHEFHARIREDIRENPENMPEEAVKADILDDVKQEAKELAPRCLPTAAMGVLTLLCFFGSHKIHISHEAAAIAAYSISEKTISTYERKMAEKLGKEKADEVKEEVVSDILSNDNAEPGEYSIVGGLTRCYDTVTGRYFYTTKEKILAAESEVNKKLLTEMRVTLTEFYYAMGLEERFWLGDSVGWDVSSYYSHDNALNVQFFPHLDDEKNPCLAMSYHCTVFDRTV